MTYLFIAHFTYAKTQFTYFLCLLPAAWLALTMYAAIKNDIAEIKQILATLVGAADRSMEHPFSEELLDKAAKDFLKLSIERGDWVKEDEIKKYIKGADWRAGPFIRKNFEFTNWYRHNRGYLYAKKDLMALNEALIKRNINLSRYYEYLESRAAFDKKLLPKPKKGKGFKIPPGVKNITTEPVPKPGPEIVKADLARLKEEFAKGNYAEWIDIYQGDYAMLKSMYIFRKYIAKDIRYRCQKWCEEFNYAQQALKEITGKKQKFTAPPDKNAIEL